MKNVLKQMYVDLNMCIYDKVVALEEKYLPIDPTTIKVLKSDGVRMLIKYSIKNTPIVPLTLQDIKKRYMDAFILSKELEAVFDNYKEK